MKIQALRGSFIVAFVVGLFGVASAQESLQRDKETMETAEFRNKLVKMLERTNQSIKLLGEQIAKNQEATFIADLNLQMGELLTQKANTLYYIQMEKMGDAGEESRDVKKFAEVVSAQEEAIETFKSIMKDFPKFDKRARVQYMLALSYKAIDKIPEFLQSAQTLMKDYPQAKEATQARLLIGQHEFEKGLDAEALKSFEPVSRTQYPYERNLARYRMGLIKLRQEHFKEALDLLIAVAKDDALKEEDTPDTVSLEKKSVQTNLKREALVDSIRAYTSVHKDDNADPLKFYSDASPTETLFQEVVTKLAYRYITIKKYQQAIGLLRALSEATADPQKIVQIYQEVLLIVPPEKRVDIPLKEIRFVIEKYNQWVHLYDLSPKLQKDAYEFFEKQVRQLGTSAHAIAKTLKHDNAGKGRRRDLLERARDFYILYLGYFTDSPMRLKLALNLADVYFELEDHIHSGEMYLRLFDAEFGVVQPDVKKKLIKNAIICGQKEKKYEFYDQLRSRGILIKAITTAMAFNPKLKNSAKLNFTLAKTRYQQGFYEAALPELFAFMQKFPTSALADDAGELILDYYNTRKDYAGLAHWAAQIAKLPLADKKFLAKADAVYKTAEKKRLDDQVKTFGGYDEFNQGKSYLAIAKSLDDETLVSAALRESVSRARQERDIETYFKSIQELMKTEKDPSKRAGHEIALANENIRITRFEEASQDLENVYSNKETPDKERHEAFNQAVHLALQMRDWGKLADLRGNSEWAALPARTKKAVVEQAAETLDTPVSVPEEIQREVAAERLSDGAIANIFKNQNRVSGSLRAKANEAIQSRCRQGGNQSYCRWYRFQLLEDEKKRLTAALESAEPSLAGIERVAKQFQDVSASYKRLEGSGDPHLDMSLMIRNRDIYEAFGTYLKRTASANPDLAEALGPKAQESFVSAEGYAKSCLMIRDKAPSVHPVGRYCKDSKSPAYGELFDWRGFSAESGKTGDPKDGAFGEAQKAAFTATKVGEKQLELSGLYMDQGYYRHAASSASYGMTLDPDHKGDYRSVLGCALAHMGYVNEAKFHLSQASDFKGYKSKCLALLHGEERS